MKVLRDKHGVSLVLVLAVMFFLLALATAAFTAAGLNFGAGGVQRDRNQLELYASSMERAIASSILQAWQASESSITDEDETDTLGGRILLEIYRNGNVYIEIGPGDFILPPGFDSSVRYSATISSIGAAGTETSMISRLPGNRCEREYVYDYDEDGDPFIIGVAVVAGMVCERSVVTMGGELRVALRTVYTTNAITGDEIEMQTVTTIKYHSILIREEDPDCVAAALADTTFDLEEHRKPPYRVPPRNLPTDERMIIEDVAVWEIIRHEKDVT